MPYTGKPSDACQRCKKLHAKCDGLRPTCGRCLKAKASCVRLAEGLDLVLRDQNAVAKALVEKRTKVVMKRVHSPHDFRESDLMVDQREDASPSRFWTISPPVSENVENHARTFFHRYYVDYPHDRRTDKGLPDLIPLATSDPISTSPISLATSAIAMVTYGAWEHSFKDSETPAVRAAYVDALKATRAALQDPATSHAEETIIAICLLGLYEQFVNAYRATISPPRHYIAAASILKEKRQMGQGNNETQRRILAAIRNCIAYRALHAGHPIDEQSSIIMDEDESSLRNVVEVLDFKVARAATLLERIRTVQETFDQHGHSDLPKSSSELNSSQVPQIQMIEDDLAAWEFLVPASWCPVKWYRDEVPQSVLKAGFYGDYCLVYPDIMICSQWNEWRLARLRTLAYLAAMSTDSDAPLLIQELIDDICATVPFILGSKNSPGLLYAQDTEYPVPEDQLADHRLVASAYGGWYSFTPLKIAFSLQQYLRPGQVPWIGMQLRRLARIYNVKPEQSPQFSVKSPLVVGMKLPGFS